MQECRYPWKRFWYERGKEPSLWDDGFLLDPDGEDAAWFNPHAQSLQDLADSRCLVLLGEPGMGKSVEIRREHHRLGTALHTSRDLTRRFDLKGFSESQITPEIFESSEVQAWRTGDHRLYLFLDSLDEGILSIGNLAHVLARKLGELTGGQRQRLYLRIGCRDRDWPPSFEDALRDLWPASQGEDGRSVRVYYLAPLRKKDVRLAGGVAEIDVDALLDAVIRKDLSAFANRPLTLEFLIDYPRRSEPIPDSREQIFYDGCLHLCSDPSDLHRSRQLDPSERLRIAARIAAAMFFSGKNAIWHGGQARSDHESDLLVSDIIDPPDSTLADARPITKREVEDALGTALFSSRGPDHTSWSHQSYGEFLAAWYLQSRGVDAVRCMNLISHPEDPDRRLVPQLHEVAAWLATMIDGVFDLILEVEPVVLLGSDIAPADCTRRRRLATRILRLIEEGDLNDTYWGFAAYRKLLYPGIADELRAHLVSRGRSRLRHTAMWIAAACSLAETAGDLVAVALDPLDDYETRWHAVWALNHIADSGTRQKLKPLAAAKPGQYPDDQLQSYALQALWPEHMSTQEVLDALKQNVPGQFLYYMAYQLLPADLPLVLSWLEGLSDPPHGGDFARFADRVLIRALDHLDVSAVREPLARMIMHSLRQDHRVFALMLESEVERALHSDSVRRRNLLAALLPLLDDPTSDAWRLCDGAPPFVLPEDTPWLVTQFRSAATPTERGAIRALVYRLAVERADHVSFEAVLAACSLHAEVAAVFGSDVVRQVPLDSSRIRRAQYLLYRHQVRRKQAEARMPPRIDPTTEIPRLLDAVEQGTLGAYVRLTGVLALQPDGAPPQDWLCPEIAASPGWLAGGPPTRERILRASEAFAREFQPTVLDPLTRSIAYDDIAGYKALRLILAYDSSALGRLSPTQWSRWAPIILRYPTSGEADEPRAHKLAAMAYASAAQATSHALSQILRVEGSADCAGLAAVERLSECWDDALTNAALAEAARSDFNAEPLQRLLGMLMDRGVEKVGAFAQSLLPPPDGADDAARARSAAAAAAILNHGRPCSWPFINPILFGDSKLGMQAVSCAVPRLHDDAPLFVRRLELAELADLLIWLTEQSPRDSSPFESIPTAKRSILETLTHAGTWAACDEMRRVVGAFPDQTWLKWQLEVAEENTRRTSWLRPSPAQVIDLIRSRDKCLVRSGRELLDAIILSLARFQDALQAKAAVERLWNDRPRTPKGEKAFAREVALHLDGDLQSRGIATGCEVEVRPGQRTDIHVKAVTRDAGSSGYVTVTVIIEAKGSWHSGVATEMRQKLVDRYMMHNNCGFGLYLIGHFPCAEWETADNQREQHRKERSERYPLDGLRALVEGQAQELSTAGRDVRALVLDCRLRS